MATCVNCVDTKIVIPIVIVMELECFFEFFKLASLVGWQKRLTWRTRAWSVDGTITLEIEEYLFIESIAFSFLTKKKLPG